jgi:phosphoribosylglycinamide formyltransferase-1
MNNIAIFASGSGTNAENFVNYFKDSNEVKVKLVLSNNPNAFIFKRMERLCIPTIAFANDDLKKEVVLDILKSNMIDYIVLAGFLKLIPQIIIKEYPNKIVNIHPALLPKFGGKGMYGIKVHEAVIAAGDTESGITIHMVNEFYDKGDIIFQAKCPVLPCDKPETLAERVHRLEYEHFPAVFYRYITGKRIDYQQ